MAVNLIRGIGTAELAYRQSHVHYADRTTILNSDEFRGRGMQFAEQNDSQLGGVNVSDKPEILPGWNLRLNLIDNGAGYDLQLEDTTDKSDCHYAALSDERAVIRESCTI